MKDTELVLKEFFPLMKTEFMIAITNPKFYPVINMLDYSSACQSWQVYDQNLTTSDVDRLFIATNYEEVDLENNDDSSLCRYEFMELIVRMGKQKYLQKKIVNTHAEATRKLLTECLLVNPTESMPWQEFRDNRLWNLEVDDLFKANREGIDIIYDFARTGHETADIINLTMEDCIDMMKLAGYEGPANERIACTAFSLSMMTIVDEMEDFDSYINLRKVEFLEFLGRVAELLFPGPQMLVDKLARLLDNLLTKFTSFKIRFRNKEEDLETESDNEDDVAQEMK